MEDYRYKQPRFTSKELLEIFPEARGIIPEKIKEWQERYDAILFDIKDVLRKAPEKDKWFYEIVVAKLFFPDLFECEKHIARLKGLYALSSGNKEIYIFEDQIERARQYPILSIAERELELKASGNKYFSLCPFHNEKTASFCIYPESNNFHCFGCGEHGDVIKLTQHFYDLDFRKTIKMLQY